MNSIMKSIGHSLEALERYFSGKTKSTTQHLANVVRPPERIIKVGTRTYKVRRRTK